MSEESGDCEEDDCSDYDEDEVGGFEVGFLGELLEGLDVFEVLVDVVDEVFEELFELWAVGGHLLIFDFDVCLIMIMIFDLI